MKIGSFDLADCRYNGGCRIKTTNKLILPAFQIAAAPFLLMALLEYVYYNSEDDWERLRLNYQDGHFVKVEP